MRPWPCGGRREPEMAKSIPARLRRRAAPFGRLGNGAAVDRGGRGRFGGEPR